MSVPKKIFISYSHDDDAHRVRVLALAAKLRADSIDAEIDQYHEDTPPSSGWPRWMERQLRECDFVLAVCTPKYRKRFDDDEEPEVGFGVAWESGIIYAAIYAFKGHNSRIIPVLCDPAHEACIPMILTVTTRLLPWTPDGYEALKRRINNTPRVVKPPLGTTPAIPTASAPRGTNLPPLGDNITSRPHELALLRAKLHLNPAAGVTRPAAATAPGGYGKTITAQLYAHEYACEYPGGRFFIRCEQGNIQTELAALAPYVGVDGSLPDPARAAAVKAALETGALALLILDNITSAEQCSDPALQALLPTTNTHLLITSRATDLPGVAEVTIGRLATAQATAILTHFRPDAGEPANAKVVGNAIEQVEGLAVAIAAMGAYMHLTPSATWATFASDLRAGRLPHMQAAEPRIAAHIGYSRAITDVLDAAFVALPQPEQQALAYAAQLPADMIPRPWLATLLKADTTISLPSKPGTNPDPAQAVIDALIHLQLLRPIVKDGKLLQMHRAHRAQLLNRAATNAAITAPLLRAIAACAAARQGTLVEGQDGKGDGTIDNPAALTDQSLRWELTPLAQMCAALWKAGQSGPAARVGVWLVAPLRALGRYAEAAACLQLTPENEAAVEAAVGHEDFAHCYSNLATIQQDQGDLPGARASMERAIAIDSKHFAPDHPTFATSYNNLALICKDEGDRAAACVNFTKALAILLKHFDESHPHVKSVRKSMKNAGCGA